VQTGAERLIRRDSALLSDYARESAAHERSIPGSIVFDKFRKLRSRSEMACRESAGDRWRWCCTCLPEFSGTKGRTKIVLA
jgi:hypothetical protein